MAKTRDTSHIREISVRGGLSPWQKAFLVIIIGFVAAGVLGVLILANPWVKPSPQIESFAIMLGRVLVTPPIMLFALVTSVTAIIVKNANQGVADTGGQLLTDVECPRITIFAPSAKEPEVLPQLVRNLADMDYPNDKYEVFLILEEDDHETLSAASQLVLPPNFHTVVTPVSQPGPRGKPRAMMYAVDQGVVTGEILVIYDAEDRPERDQLRKAATAAARHPDVSCFQAKLRWENALQNPLTMGLAAGYAFQFELKSTGLAATQGVFPLGGTSNFVRVKDLQEAGWWDPSNVTEDLGLGVSLYRAGKRSLVLDSVTWEEATFTFKSQMKQASRWLKGHIATLVAHTRDPLTLIRDLGPWGFVTFIVVVAAPHPAVLAAPLFWGMTMLYAVTGSNTIEAITPPIAFYVGTLALLANAGFVWAGMLAALKSGQYRLIPWLVLMPLYWATVLLCAAGKAAYEIATGRLSYWDKTQHGLIGRKEVIAPTIPVPAQSRRQLQESPAD